jgi:competence protein ComEC
VTPVLLALAWLASIATIALWGVPAWLTGACLAALAPLAGAWRGRRAAALVACMALLAVAGGWRFSAWLHAPSPDLARYVGSQVTVEGRIASEPDPGLTTVSYEVEAEHVTADGTVRAIDGKLRATFPQYTELRPGAPVRLAGHLGEAPVFPDFDYRAYLARRGVVGTMFFPRLEGVGAAPRWHLAGTRARVRLALEDVLARSLPEPEASLAAGIAFGRDAGMSPELYDDFRAAGLAHLVAVSGGNVSLVAAVVFFVVVPLAGRRRALLPAALAVFAYLAIAGPSASVIRAGLMATVFLGGAALGRQQSSLAALGVAAVVMTAVQPAAALDVGFQLSVAATAGLIVLTPWLRFALEVASRPLGGLLPGAVLDVAALSLAASIATLPLVWLNFGQVSLAGPFVNVVAAPLFVVSFASSGLTALAGLAWEPAGWALGLAAYYPLALLAWLAQSVAGFPFAAVAAPPLDGAAALAAYLALAAIGWPAYRYLPPSRGRIEPGASARGLRLAGAGAGAGCMSLAILLTTLPGLSGPGELQVTVLDVGQGDAILVTTPHGRRFLVDGGPSGIQLAREVGAVLPHWEREVDAVLLTHPEEDHLGGLVELLDRYDVATAYDTGRAASSPAYAIYRRLARTRTLSAGDAFEQDGVRFEVLWPPAGYESEQTNATSLVLRLTYGEVSFLLAGDIGADVQRELMEGGNLTVTVLKVPHHGSKTSDPGFFAAVDPSLAVIPVGAGNPFGHPAPEVLAALSKASVLRTDLHGRVTISTDGQRLRVRTAKGAFAPPPSTP